MKHWVIEAHGDGEQKTAKLAQGLKLFANGAGGGGATAELVVVGARDRNLVLSFTNQPPKQMKTGDTANLGHLELIVANLGGSVVCLRCRHGGLFADPLHPGHLTYRR